MSQNARGEGVAIPSMARAGLRSIIKQVHPDLFPANPHERQVNTESLKVLNVYVDQLSARRQPRPALVEFYVKDGASMKKVQARLTASGSMSPLFFAFGLIDAEQLAQDSSSMLGSGGSADDTSLLLWLRDQVQEAVRTAEQHELLKWHIRKLRTGLEERYKMAGVQVGAEYAASILEQERQVESLKILDQALASLTQQGISFEGINMQLYHPLLCPKESTGYVDELGFFNMRTDYMKAFVADDGCVHVVAERDTIVKQLKAIDLKRAGTLTDAAYFWVRRVRELTQPTAELLGVRSVWCDTKTEQSSQKFVLWAGYLLEKKEQIKAALAGRTFSFSIIVHIDAQAPLVSFNNSSPILNVSADCPSEHLLEFLVSEAGGEASETASTVHVSRAKEEALLENLRKALDAKCVIKICMSDKVLDGAQRLLDNAALIRSSVDLAGACIALDDCYEVWDSGFISIPYDFSIQDLPDMVRLLQSGQRPSESASSSSSSTKSYAQSGVAASISPRGLASQGSPWRYSASSVGPGTLLASRRHGPAPCRAGPLQRRLPSAAGCAGARSQAKQLHAATQPWRRLI